MTAGARVAAFGALLAAIFAVAALAGRAAGPVPEAEREHGASSTHGGAAPAAGAELRLRARGTTPTPGRPHRFTFAIEDAHGGVVRDFEIEQNRRMHLIVVRRDLRRFQHLHPAQDASGRWSVNLTLPDAGVYHAFADFQTAGTRHTLGTDLFAAGRFEPLPLPGASNVATTGGYDVSLRDDGGTLRFSVDRGGRLVTDLQPYLGAAGHLVMLRAGDLAYQHVHPVSDDQLAFDTSEAEPGTYRLFLQFRHAGRVRTVAFTREVRP